MSIITYPLNNVEYTAEDAELYNCTRTSGVYSGEDFSCTVSGTNNNVTIGEGVGWIRNSRFSGKVFANKAPVTLKLDIADAINPRIDIVAVRFDVETNTTDLVIKKGAAAANPVMPEIVQTENVYELYLFSVYRETAATAITADNVTDLRLDASVCGLMADAVTSVDTSVINKQFTAYLEHIKKELADLKVDKIDAYTREETLSDETKALLGMEASAVPDDAISAIKILIDGVNANANTKAKIATGTYTGTGKYGEANPSSLTLPFEANTLIIVGTDGFLAVCPHLTTSYVSFEAHTVNSSDYKPGGLFVKKNGNTVQRYSTAGSPAATWTPRFQANASGTTYRYIAWG